MRESEVWAELWKGSACLPPGSSVRMRPGLCGHPEGNAPWVRSVERHLCGDGGGHSTVFRQVAWCTGGGTKWGESTKQWATSFRWSSFQPHAAGEGGGHTQRYVACRLRRECGLCDPDDQATFRAETNWSQWLLCSGPLSQVRRPRFFWVFEDINFDGVGLVESAPNYKVARVASEKEPPSLWTAPGWRWMSEEDPVSLPTFTRSIPRKRPPVNPAGIKTTPLEAQQRWRDDAFRFPPYTYQDKFCMEKNGHLRVACACEREVLMGFKRGHTRLRKRALSEDTRCSMVGNSFHTGVVAALLRSCLMKHYAGVEHFTPEVLHSEFIEELRYSQQEIYQGHKKPILLEDDETWLDRLEQQSDAIVPRDLDELKVQIQLVQRMAELSSYRGTDVHVDTLSFYRPDRLPRSSVDARQWLWKVAKGWRWKQPDHINVLEMEALYQTVRWRARSNRLFRKRFLHLVDSQVVLGVAAKGRTSSRKLRRSLHKYNMLVLALHTFPLLGWVLSHLNPSDVPSRWYEPPSSM